jgi:hypothetical protein
MSHFLVIFDRTKPGDASVERIDGAHEAQLRLFQVEQELRDDPDRGVVLLVAEREEDLHRTHGHYFKSLEELTQLAT